MKKLVETLASLKLAVILLVVLLVGLSAGTILESRTDAATAGRLVYYSWWFLGLQGLFAVNVACSIANLFPWGKKRVGFVVTHASLLLILAGAALTYFGKVEGQLGLWEGESGAVAVERDPQGKVVAQHELPFSVKLDDFVLETYQGTMRPSGFASQVVVTDIDTGKSFPARIWMNTPLHHRGWSLFQSSYQQDGGREATVLSVSKDPGQLVVFAGYATLVLGMILVLLTRVSQMREREAFEAKVAAGGMSLPTMGRSLLVALALLPIATSALAAGPREHRVPEAAPGPARRTGHAARHARPRDGLDRDGIPFLERRGPGRDVHGVALRPAGGREGSRRQAGQQGARRCGRDRPRGEARLLRAARREPAAHAARPGGGPGGLPGQAPDRGPQGRREARAPPELPLRRPPAHTSSGRSPLRATPGPAGTCRSRSRPRRSSPTRTGLACRAGRPSKKIDGEILYNRVNPSRLAWLVLLAALAVSIAAWVRSSRLLDGVSFVLLILGFAAMSWGIGMRWAAGERIPAANMYESLLFLAWGVGLFAVIAYALLKNRIVVINAAAMSALTMALTDLLPMDRFIHPIAPVLAGTPWLAIHVPIIMVGYAVLALGLVVAHMQIGFAAFGKGRGALVEKMYELLYWYMFVGSIFLLAGILTGSVWAASSWGRYWGWDPKEVWSLVAFLAYMAILHLKVDKVIGTFGVAVISIAAFQTILMTYLGVNFVLNVGMHSYGMGDSPVVKWMIVTALVELVFLVVAGVAWRDRKRMLAA